METGESRFALSIVLIGCFFALLMTFYMNPSFTSYSVKDIGYHGFVLEPNELKVLEIEKSEKTVLELDVESENYISIFVETEDCKYWVENTDTDNKVLESVTVIEDGIYRFGDPSTKTKGSIDVYNSEELCLIFYNTEIDKNNYVNVKIKETDKNKWKIVG